jgi:hypothetical protein
MRSKVLVFAMAGCSSGDSTVVGPDPNDLGDAGPNGNNGRTDGARGDAALNNGDGSNPADQDGWSDFDAGPPPDFDAGPIPAFDGFDLDGFDLDGFDLDGFGGDGGPTPENPDICGNGLDDDRNGLVDDNCLCVAGRTQRYYLGDVAAAGRGVGHANLRGRADRRELGRVHRVGLGGGVRGL